MNPVSLASETLARRRVGPVTQPLAGIKVLDFSEHGFVPSGAAVLADWGADVVKLERPEGDPMREIIRQGLVADVDGYDYLFQLVTGTSVVSRSTF